MTDDPPLDDETLPDSSKEPAPARPSIVDGKEHAVDPRSVKGARIIAMPVICLIAILPLMFITIGWAMGGIPVVVYLPLLCGLLIIAGLALGFTFWWKAARRG